VGRTADTLAIPGFLLGAWGIRATFKQAKDARTAAEAARAAAAQTEAAIIRNNLLAAIAGILAAERDILDALSGGSAQQASQASLDWRAKAIQVRGLLEAAGLGTPSLSSAIQDSITLAFQVAMEAKTPGATGVPAAIGNLLGATVKVTDDLGTLASRESYRTGEGS
jgi:hypothetical protein